ncbi:hypothetical protein RJT34_24500 [Clitoria ternatea]|uniref:Uncharacterized protein n=1 Tax=Clitoria ternatea TaxID=43366 RepID=A0AAN9FMZ8_CLITE
MTSFPFTSSRVGIGPLFLDSFPSFRIVLSGDLGDAFIPELEDDNIYLQNALLGLDQILSSSSGNFSL